ncbi:MAG: hypothetical protein H5U21_04970 [Porphyrobacter sp.]|nr:hypothetical protein [Porphyrobacter sp.]
MHHHHRFLATGLERAALASIAAILAFNLFAFARQKDMCEQAALRLAPFVELA